MCITTSVYFQVYSVNFLEIAGKLDAVYLQNNGFIGLHVHTVKHSFNKSSCSVYYERILPRDLGPG